MKNNFNIFHLPNKQFLSVFRTQFQPLERFLFKVNEIWVIREISLNREHVVGLVFMVCVCVCVCVCLECLDLLFQTSTFSFSNRISIFATRASTTDFIHVLLTNLLPGTGFDHRL